jgi:hypothetical protein
MKYYIGEDFNIATAKDLPHIMQELEVEHETPDIKKKLKQSIHAKICREVFTMFDMSVYNENITLFLEDDTNNMIGFLMFTIPIDKSSIEILFLCSKKKGSGKILLDKIKEFAKIMEIPKIVLEVAMVMNPTTYEVEMDAVNKLTSYYAANNFKIGKNPTTMEHDVDIQKGGKTRNRSRKSRRNNGKNRRTRKN